MDNEKPPGINTEGVLRASAKYKVMRSDLYYFSTLDKKSEACKDIRVMFVTVNKLNSLALAPSTTVTCMHDIGARPRVFKQSHA